MKRKRSVKKMIGIVILVVVLLGLIGNSRSGSRNQKKEPENGAGSEIALSDQQAEEKQTPEAEQVTEQKEQTGDSEQGAETEQTTEPEDQTVESEQEIEQDIENEQEEKPDLTEEPEEDPVSEEPEDSVAEEPEKEPEEKQEEDPAEEQEEKPEEESSGNGSGISPEFKEAMDSYEAFFDEYIAFMEKYSNSDNPAGMIMDYSNYMLKYADAMEKLNQMDSENMTIEEQAYYIEVMARIQKKLLESSQ